jgi:hypothetical protein
MEQFLGSCLPIQATSMLGLDVPPTLLASARNWPFASFAATQQFSRFRSEADIQRPVLAPHCLAGFAVFASILLHPLRWT